MTLLTINNMIASIVDTAFVSPQSQQQEPPPPPPPTYMNHVHNNHTTHPPTTPPSSQPRYRPPNMFNNDNNNDNYQIPTYPLAYRPPNMFGDDIENNDNNDTQVVFHSPPGAPFPNRRRRGGILHQLYEHSNGSRRHLDFESIQYEEQVNNLYDHVVSVMQTTGIELYDDCTDGKNKWECSICLQDDNNDKKMGSLPCGHTFHNHCIVTWFSQKKFTCPNCRAKVDVLSLLKR